MKTRGLFVWMSCFCLAFCAVADTVVPAGASLTITNSEDLGISPLQLGTDATLAFASDGAAPGGLNEYTRTGAGGLGTPGVTAYGTWTRIATNAFWAGTNITATTTEYIYTGRWLIPAAGVYSFYEHIDDAALIAVDGRTVLQNGVYNTSTCVRDVPLAAGWHDLELRIYNNAAGGGVMSSNLASGLLFSPSNDLISIANQTNAFPFADAGDGGALKPVHNCTLFQKVFVADSAAFDLAAHGTGLPLALTASLLPAYTSASAKLTLAGGTGELLFGMPNTLGAQFVAFNADVAFTGVSNPAGVTFRDFSTLITVPTSCAWRVADGATVALYGTNLFGAGDVTLTNHNLYVISPFALSADATVRVRGTNLTAALKPCSLDSNAWWSGWAVTLTNDISLEGVNSTALFPINVDLTVQGTVSGTGSVVKTGNARTQIKEPCTFVGPVSVSDLGTFVIEADTAGHSNNTVTVNSGATFSLYPAGYGTTDTTAWIKSLRGGSTSGKVYVPARQTLTVDTFDGALTVQGNGSTLRVNALGTNAVLSVTGQTAVILGSAAPGATLILDNGTSLAVPAGGLALEALTLTSGSVPVSGNFTVGVLGGAGKLVKQGGDTLSVYFSTNTAGVQVDAGKLTLAPPAPATVLGSLPALWLDASASNVFTQYKSYAFTNGFINIERWNDCRPGAPYYGYNGRGNDNQQVYPYVMTNNLNGLPVVSMGSYQLVLSPPYIGPEGNGIEARRLPLSTNLYPQHAILVFGSQNGGGAAVLGGDPAFNRAGWSSNDFRNAATPILSNGAYPVWTNGVAVTATNTGFTGGYQILSVNTKGQLVNALGWRVDNTTAGGQNYGEVLLYTNALTTTQRMAAEAYLAEKWNLPYPATAVQAATVASGATLELGGPFTLGLLDGKGSVVVSDGASVEIAGLFSGTLTLGSSVLNVSELPVTPGAECVPAISRTVWFDPCQTNRAVLGAVFTPTRPLAIAGLYDCTTTNMYLLGTCKTDLSTAVDRRPWLAATNGPLGETQHWIDFSNIYSGDTRGNTLRLNRNPAYIGTETINPTPTNVQSGFIVLDSSRGGGVPITFDVNASSVVTRDNPTLVSSPIWGSGTTTLLKSGQTFLDSVPVSGASRGYNGTTELLSFIATNVFKATYFGWYGGDSTANRERLGEIILFESTLDSGTRAAVEAYLMKKWLRKSHAGYSDLTAATVSGSGTVRASHPTRLPILGAGFTGSVALTGTAFDYTLTTNAAGAFVATPATAFPGALSVPATGTINLTFAVRPPAGTYPLITYGSVTGTGFAGWSLATAGERPAGPVALKPTGTALSVQVVPLGTLFLVQ